MALARLLLLLLLLLYIRPWPPFSYSHRISNSYLHHHLLHPQHHHNGIHHQYVELADSRRGFLTDASCIDKDPVRVAAGLKASIHNPNVSEEAKERAVDKLEHMGAERGTTASESNEDTNRVLGGYKATLKSKSFSTLHIVRGI